MPDTKNEEDDKMESIEGGIQLSILEKINKFSKLCDNLKSCVLKLLESLDQTDNVNDIRNMLNNAKYWNEIFDASILGMKELVVQMKEKGDVKYGKEH